MGFATLLGFLAAGWIAPAAAAEETVMAAFFDPNAPEREVLAALDLSERAIRAWMSYTAKGGRFRQPADLDEFFTAVAEELALERVRTAMGFRRFGIFSMGPNFI